MRRGAGSVREPDGGERAAARRVGEGELALGPVQPFDPLPCIPDEGSDCVYSPTDPRELRIDPLDPNHRVLVLAALYGTGETHIDSIDLETGVIVESIPIQTDWGAIQLDSQYQNIADVSTDNATARVFVTLVGQGPVGEILWAVVAIDRDSGDQHLVYDGSPTADGKKLACMPNASFDIRENRLVLVEPPGEASCQGNVFTVDVVSGAFASL